MLFFKDFPASLSSSNYHRLYILDKAIGEEQLLFK